MNKLTDSNGKPLKSKEPKEGYDLVRCEVLVESIEKYNVALPMTTPTPKGSVAVNVNQVLTSIVTSMYQVMKHMKQNEIIIHIEDVSSELITEKKLTLAVGQLVPKENKNETESEKEG